MEGMIVDSQRFSLHDGPGIRTTIYVKGCNMTCIWCHNPESIDWKPEIAFYKTKCVGCNICYDNCPTQAITIKDGERKFDKSLCTRCYRCIEVCPSGALWLVGKKMTVEEVFEVIMADMPYYTASGGGMTLSGGEPLMQVDFSEALFEKCYKAGVDTAIETNMSAPFETVQRLLPYLNRIYCDIKSMDDIVHKKTTSVSHKNVLDNIKSLSSYDIPLVIRTPLIPGVTDSEDNILQTARWIKENSEVEYYELLNYNAFAKTKHENMSKEYELVNCTPLKKERLELLASIARSQGVKVVCEQE